MFNISGKKQLQSILPSDRIFFQEDNLMDKNTYLSYGKDYTKILEPNFSALLFPKTEQEIVKIVQTAIEYKIPLVPSGGRTGLAGAAVASKGEIVLSLDKMNRFLELDDSAGTATVESGMITKEIHNKVEEQGFYFPVDFAASASSHIGGNIATNVGGIRVVRYGLLRNWILGLSVVTGKGEILRFNGKILKNNTGYDLKQLFIGSEGTLGVITQATLALTQIPKESRSVFLAISNFNKILEIFKYTKHLKTPILAFETLSHFCLEIVMKGLSLKPLFSEKNPYYVLIEFELDKPDAENHIFDFIEKISEKGWIEDGIMAENSQQNSDFWKYREGLPEVLVTNYTLSKNDISLPLNSMNTFIEDFDSILKKYPDIKKALFGHIGDCNLHINLIKPENMDKDEFFTHCKEINLRMFKLVHKYEGSISAEHGIGILKKDFLKFSRTLKEIEMMKDIKKIFDPYNIMNPGKIF